MSKTAKNSKKPWSPLEDRGGILVFNEVGLIYRELYSRKVGCAIEKKKKNPGSRLNAQPLN